ncbi:hypothetical protein BLJAPNOD_05347 [Ensifer sp. M14]|jgi:hypothetical protein|nr:hypothetical protein BLJAPNOD_05347 [Ensifer sp. M14]
MSLPGFISCACWSYNHSHLRVKQALHGGRLSFGWQQSQARTLLQQPRLDRLSNDRQLQQRLATHEALFDEIQLLQSPDDFF